MFKIKNLHVSIDNKKILKDFNINIKPGELHVIMGPNGSGKSTLTNTIAGKENYEVTSGDIIYNNKSLLPLNPEERVGEGVFVSFQYPTSLPGVNNVYFLKEAVNSIRKYNGQDEISSVEFMKKLNPKYQMLILMKVLLTDQLTMGFQVVKKREMKFYSY